MFIAYAHAFNKATDRTGVLFETPFGRKLVDIDEYLRMLILYINQNAQKHDLVKDFRLWQWSSYKTYLSEGPTNIQRDKVVEWFGGKERLMERHLQLVDDTLIAELIEDDLSRDG